jgi:hypothetical protein
MMRRPTFCQDVPCESPKTYFSEAGNKSRHRRPPEGCAISTIRYLSTMPNLLGTDVWISQGRLAYTDPTLTMLLQQREAHRPSAWRRYYCDSCHRHQPKS